MPVPPAPDPIRFAYWMPNVSGGLVTSRIEQRTDWGYEYNKRLARLAEDNGFDYALSFGTRVLPLVREFEAQQPAAEAEPAAARS